MQVSNNALVANSLYLACVLVSFRDRRELEFRMFVRKVDIMKYFATSSSIIMISMKQREF